MKGRTDIDSNSLEQLIGEHQAIHLLKRFAHLEKDGIVPEYFFTDPRHEYVLNMINIHSLIVSSIEYSEMLVNQLLHEPPSSWIDSFNISFEEFAKQNFNIFSVILYSVFDQVLLLINETLIEPMSKRSVNYKNVQKEIKQNIPLSKCISEYFDDTNSIAMSRHSFVHEGVSRDAGRLDGIHRLNVIMKAWDIPKQSIHTNIENAKQELIDKMNSELKTTSQYLREVDKYLVPNYLAKLKKLGGLDKPSLHEVEEARKTINYLSGEELGL